MKLLVTGATGFLGRYVVGEALRRGHFVTAMVRGAETPKFGWAGHPNLKLVKADLTERQGLSEAVAGADAVIHLAAAKAGDRQAQHAGIVLATENLLAAMADAGVRQLVLISSFSVYDYLELPAYSTLTEDSPLEQAARNRDDYTRNKLAQERLVRERASAAGCAFTILRPGVIYGKDNLFTPRLGIRKSRLLLRIGARAQLPLTYVENCAEAIVLAAECQSARGETLNVVDDNPPTQRHYAALVRGRLSPRPIIVPIAWSVMRFLAALATETNNVLLGGRAKIPGLFVPARLHARCKPVQYSNEKIKNVLKWKPRYSLTEALDRSAGSSNFDLTQVELEAPASKAGNAEVAA